ncbi:hypothetical protein [Massilia sp. MS-15]|uniref:hypothetical protein n=1 Tax=Massilia sp. MS-15 TaxID=2878200 RepID=UPI001CD23AEB|nr:hypothetical protein [Massilia sp. MS-15]MCA1245723.1 hypothetical protein [Massilia sp. MS-15]
MSLHVPPSGMRRLVACCVAAVLAAGSFTAASGARAAPVDAAPLYTLAMTFEAGGERSAHRVQIRAEDTFSVTSGDWRLEMAVYKGKTPDDVRIEGKVYKGPNIVSAPTLMTQLQEKASIKIDNNSDPFSLSMVVSPQR